MTAASLVDGFKLRNEFVLIEPADVCGKTQLLALPERYRTYQCWGYVLAVGPDCEAVEPGDAVVFERSRGQEVWTDDLGWIVLVREPAVLATLR